MRRALIKIFLIIFAIFLFWVIIFHIHFNLSGKQHLIQRLEALTGRKVTIGALYATLPTNIHIRNLEVEGIGTIDQIYAAGGFYNIFTKHFGFVLVQVYHPALDISRSANQSFAQVMAPACTLFFNNAVGTGQGASLFSSWYVNRLLIDNGNITYTDAISGQPDLTIRIEDLTVRIDHLNFGSPEPQVMNFDLKARIPWRQGAANGTVGCTGWLNWAKKDMQASLKIDNIDAVTLSPYFARYIDIGKSGIESAKLQLTSDITGLNNDINAQCKLELTDIVFKPHTPEDESTRQEQMATTVLDIFKDQAQGNKVVLSFPVKTQMNNPQFGICMIKTAVEDKIMTERAKKGSGLVDIIFFPAKLAEGTVKVTADMTKAVIGGVFSIGWELLTPFKKERPVQAEPAPK